MSDYTHLLVEPGQGESIHTMTIKARAEQLGGDFSIMQATVEPHQLLPPHTHLHEDQAVFIIDGELEFEIGGAGGLRFSAGPGDVVLKPRGISHGFWNIGDVVVRYIELSGQNGFERFIDGRKDGVEAFVRNAQEELGMQLHVERIPQLLREHGLTQLAGSNIELPPELLG